jgi:hypothetical protein
MTCAGPAAGLLVYFPSTPCVFFVPFLVCCTMDKLLSNQEFHVMLLRCTAGHTNVSATQYG